MEICDRNNIQNCAKNSLASTGKKCAFFLLFRQNLYSQMFVCLRRLNHIEMIIKISNESVLNITKYLEKLQCSLLSVEPSGIFCLTAEYRNHDMKLVCLLLPCMQAVHVHRQIMTHVVHTIQQSNLGLIAYSHFVLLCQQYCASIICLYKSAGGSIWKQVND